MGSCKSRHKSAYELCSSEVAINRQERLMCARLYVKNFPSCFFKRKRKGKSCVDDVLQGFSKCVMESQSYGETFACENKKEERRMLCLAATSKRGGEQAILEVKRVQRCNECLGYYDACLVRVRDESEHDICLENRANCRGCKAR